MRAAAFLACTLLAASAAAEPGVRIAVLHASPLLKSESKALAALQKRLAKTGPVTLVDADEAETQLVRSPSGELPKVWADAGTVVVIEILPPTGKAPRQRTTGVGSVLVYRPPQTEPVWAERIEGSLATPLAGDALGPWITAAMTLAAGAR